MTLREQKSRTLNPVVVGLHSKQIPPSDNSHTGGASFVRERNRSNNDQ
jgi:hypothetical protein